MQEDEQNELVPLFSAFLQLKGYSKEISKEYYERNHFPVFLVLSQEKITQFISLPLFRDRF
jgi:hypothetical protein